MGRVLRVLSWLRVQHAREHIDTTSIVLLNRPADKPVYDGQIDLNT